jgi:hypothetical protein
VNRWTEDDPYPGPKVWNERNERLWTDADLQAERDDEAARGIERVLLTLVVLISAFTIAALLVVAK